VEAGRDGRDRDRDGRDTLPRGGINSLNPSGHLHGARRH
jgi:hypothetical protein